MATTDQQPLTKQERVYRTMRERILTGEYGPGYRIVMDSLAAEMNVSVLPIREAVRRLEAEGLVVHRPNVGAQVAPADPSMFDEEMAVLAVLEGAATALAAPRIDAAEIARLRAINASMAEAAASMDSLGFGRLNREFHMAIVEHCPNRAFITLIADVERRLDAIRRTVFVQIPYRGAESVAEHTELIDLIESGADAALIEDAARRHKLRTVERFDRWRSEHKAAS